MKKLFLILCALVLCSSSYAGNINDIKKVIARKNALSTPTFVKQNAAVTNWGATCTVTITPNAGTNRCFIVAGSGTVQTVDSATFGGAAMDDDTLIQVTQDTMHGGMFFECTDVGVAEVSVVVTYSGECANACWVIQVDGVNTGDIVEASDTDTGDNADNQVETTVTPVTNNTLLVSMVADQDDTGAFSVCNATGQTLLDETTEAGSQEISGGYFDLSVAAEKNQCFLYSAATDDTIMITAAINPAGS